MKDANVGAMPELWQPTSTNWLKAEMTALECAARLKQSGQAPPVVWLPQALSTQPLAPGLLLRDKYKLLGLSVFVFRSPSPSQPRVVCFRTSPCSGKSVELFKCQANRNGYLWVGTHGAFDNELESDVVQTLCNLVRVPSVLQAPGEFLSGRLTASVMSRLDWPRFDADFMRRLDAEPTWQFMAFACGTTMELASGELGQASPQQCLKRHVSYPYPAKEMASIAAQEEALGISCLDTFKEIAEWLRHPLNQENPVFPAQIRSKLEKLTDGIPELVFFKLMHDSFTPRYDQQECPSPETYGGWQATVFRTMVALAAGLGCSHENSIFDLGEEGDNGKGVLAAATRETFDGYYEELPLATVTKDPPSGNETSPQVYKLQGARFLGTPESEKSIAIKAIWIKLLADNSTRWTARTLYKLDLQFRIPALFALSSNLKVNLTSIDGGVHHRVRLARVLQAGAEGPLPASQEPRGSQAQQLLHAGGEGRDLARDHGGVPGLLHGGRRQAGAAAEGDQGSVGPAVDGVQRVPGRVPGEVHGGVHRQGGHIEVEAGRGNARPHPRRARRGEDQHGRLPQGFGGCVRHEGAARHDREADEAFQPPVPEAE